MKLVALCLVVLLLTSMVEPGECFFRRLKEKLTKTWNKYKAYKQNKAAASSMQNVEATPPPPPPEWQR